MNIKIEVSARHVHLSKKDLYKLFGDNFELSKERFLSQKGEFVAKEKLNIMGDRKKIENVSILGPEREKTQVEISMSDSIGLGVDTPIKCSGDHSNTPGIFLEGPNGKVLLSSGVIIAKRHIHLSSKTAEDLNLEDGMEVKVSVKGERALVFEKVLLRVRNDFIDSMHIDVDEGNAAGIPRGGEGEIIL